MKETKYDNGPKAICVKMKDRQSHRANWRQQFLSPLNV